MSTPSGGSIPTGYYPPFSLVTDENHSAWTIIATSLGLACVLVFFVARVIVRYTVTSSLGQDDLLLGSSVVSAASTRIYLFSGSSQVLSVLTASAQAIAIIQSSLVLFGCSVGLGESMTNMSSSQQTQIQKINYASNLLWAVSLGLSKISVASLIRRIGAFGPQSVIFNAITACLALWTGATFLTLALQCSLSHPWITMNETCINEFIRWKAICAFDIITELLLLASAIYLVWGIQTTIDRKMNIVAGFACRIPIVVPIAFRLATYDEAGLSDDPSLRETSFIVWTQTELSYSVICAIIPSLLQFMRALNTTFGDLREHGSKAYSSRRRSRQSFPMSVLRSKTNTVESQKSQTVEDAEELTNFKEHAAEVASHPVVRPKSSVASNFSRLSIHKTVEYSVQHE